jgi:predicted nucleotidyltransferase
MTIDPARAAATLLQRERRRHAAVEARRAGLRARLPALVTTLSEEYGARRIVLFGSLAWGGFHAGSDVDVAVEGIAAERMPDAAATACETMDATVELFRLETLPASFRQRILDQGEALA